MNSILLWSFWSFSTWTPEQTSAFWTALGAIGTVGTLWYAIRQGIKNSKKINDLAEITKQLADQNRLILNQNELIIQQIELQKMVMKKDVRPEFRVINGPSEIGQVHLLIQNLGQKATITNVEFIEDRIKFQKVAVPKIVYPNEQFSITGFVQKINVFDQQWTINMDFFDIYNNSYRFTIQGQFRTFRQSITDHLKTEGVESTSILSSF